MMKKLSLWAILLMVNILFRSERITFPGNIIYDPFYHITAVDSSGGIYHLTNVSYIVRAEEPQKRHFFFWIRRGTDQGIASYALDFNRIKSIEFTGFIEDAPSGYCPGQITLVNGTSYAGFIGCEGYLEGFDTDFGTGAKLYLNYNLLKSLEFKHGGVYKRCPFCGVIYYDDALEKCPFDQTELVPQTSRK